MMEKKEELAQEVLRKRLALFYLLYGTIMGLTLKSHGLLLQCQQGSAREASR